MTKDTHEQVAEIERQDTMHCTLEQSEMETTIMTQWKFDAGLRCLTDNGIEADEAETVLQALCYILLDEETEQFMA